MKEPTPRQKKLARELQRELGTFFQQNIDPLFSCLTTVSVVRTTPDLGTVRVYLTTFPEDKIQPLLTWLEEHHTAVRHRICGTIKHLFRTMPEFEFYFDDLFAEQAKVDQLLNSIPDLKNPSGGPEDS